MLKKAVNKIFSVKRNLERGFYTGMMTLMCTLPAYATNYSVSTSVNIDALVGKLIGVILNIVRYAGAFVTLIGIYSFLSALKRDDADSKQNGITTALVGIALMGLGALLKSAGILK